MTGGPGLVAAICAAGLVIIGVWSLWAHHRDRVAEAAARAERRRNIAAIDRLEDRRR